MSHRLFEGDVVFFQRLLAGTGLYTGQLDGVWGPKTDRASAAWDVAFAEIRDAVAEFDGRTESLLRTLLPGAQKQARLLLALLRDSGLDARVVSGTRTYAEQEALFRRGRYGDKRSRVTNARAGQSNHNFGVAWDVGLFAAGSYLQESPLYDRAGVLSRDLPEVEWGGDWKTFKDRPHYQVATRLTLEEIRARFEAGRQILADPRA